MVAQGSGSKWLVVALVVLSGCRGESELCDVERLQRALDRASPGDVVLMGRCRVEGNLSVPEEVTLEGPTSLAALAGEQGLVSTEGHGVRLAAGATVRNLVVDSSGESGVFSEGAGTAITDVRVEARRGVGIAVRGGSASLVRVEAVGPVDDPSDARFVRVAGFRVEGECPSSPCECTPGEVDGERVCNAEGEWATWTAVYGIYARDAELTLEDVRVSRFAEVGAVFDDSAVTWTNGGAFDNLGVGSLVRGGSAMLSDVEVSGTAEGLRGLAAYGVIGTEAAVLDSAGLALSDNQRYGLLALGASGTHADLLADGNGDVGVWIGDSDGVSLMGDSALTNNGFAGLVVSASRNVVVDGATVESTRTVRRTLGDLTGAQEIGDGVHLSQSPGVTLRNVALALNARGGLLVDLADGTPTFEGVTVDVSAEGFGAAAGDRTGGNLMVTPPGGWDTGITRTPDATTRDAALTGTLDAIGVSVPPGASERVGIVFPMF